MVGLVKEQVMGKMEKWILEHREVREKMSNVY